MRKRKRLAPIGTQERQWQDAIRKAYGSAKKFGKKRKRGGGQRHRKKQSPQQIRIMSELHNQYGGSVVGDSVAVSVGETQKSPSGQTKRGPQMSVMKLFDNKLEDRRSDLYPE